MIHLCWYEEMFDGVSGPIRPSGMAAATNIGSGRVVGQVQRHRVNPFGQNPGSIHPRSFHDERFSYESNV